MEKCGKVWRQEHQTAIRREGQNGAYSISGAGGAREMRTCSACAGDYEDPDRTAWMPDDTEELDFEDAPRAMTEEFPAEE